MSKRASVPTIKWVPSRGCFYIQWYEKGQKRRRSTGTSDGREAQAVLEEFLAASKVMEGQNRPNEMTVGECLSYYIEHHAPTVTDPERIIYAIAPLVEFFDDTPLIDITKSLCLRYGKWRNKAPGTIHRELSTITAAQNFCVRERKLTQAIHVPLPQRDKGRVKFLTVSEAARLLWAARKSRGRHLPLIILIGLYTGARIEAILSLTWDRVDFTKNRIDFQIPGRKITKKRRPIVPISRKLRPVLIRAYANRPEDFDLMEHGGPVVHWKGKPIKRSIQGFKRAVRRAGLDDDVCQHTMRHTCGTWMAQAGVDLWKIAGYLGQTLASTTELYAHHHPDFMQEALAATERRQPAYESE